jgi:hypothetical protein
MRFAAELQLLAHGSGASGIGPQEPLAGNGLFAGASIFKMA